MSNNRQKISNLPMITIYMTRVPPMNPANFRLHAREVNFDAQQRESGHRKILQWFRRFVRDVVGAGYSHVVARFMHIVRHCCDQNSFYGGKSSQEKVYTGISGWIFWGIQTSV